MKGGKNYAWAAVAPNRYSWY